METIKQNLPTKKTSNKVAKQQPKDIKGWIKAYEGEIAKALPTVMTPERFTRIALSAVSNTPKLAECTPQSFLGAMMNAAQLGLEPNTPLGQAYLIPYGRTVQFQLGYKGMLDLAYRSGDINYITAETVYENDEFDYELGLYPTLKHIPAKAKRGKPAYYYAVFKLTNGGQAFQVMSYDDVQNHAKKFSKSFNSGPWKTNFDEMAKKTVLKKLLKYAPIKTEFVRGVAQDETVKSFDKANDDNAHDMSMVADETVYDAEYEEMPNEDPATGEIKE